MASLVNRMIRAASMDTHLYEEVEADEGAVAQAAIVVVLASVAAGIGGADDGASGFLSATIAALIGWCVWAFVIFIVGTKLLPSPQTHATFGQLLRALGFAASPGLLRFLGIIPILGWLVLMVVSIWMLCTMVVAVRQALDYESTLRAVGVCIIGWVFYVVVAGVAASIF